MTDGAITQRVIVVTGDVTMDWNLARTVHGQTRATAWDFDDCTEEYWQRGGAALLADLVTEIAALQAASAPAWSVRQVNAPRNAAAADAKGFCHTYAMWSPFRRSDREAGPPVWRVAEFLGHNHRAQRSAAQPESWQCVEDDSAEAQIVVLDDANLGFRANRELWPAAIRAAPRREKPWVLLKMAVPVAQGPLWQHLHTSYRGRLVVVMSATDLRRSEVQISQQLSWERTTQDLYWELLYNPRINSLAQSAHVVISFGAAGVVLFSRVDDAAPGTVAAPHGHHCTLFFDPEVIEGMWEQHHPGGMIGCNTCLVAALAHRLMGNLERPDLDQGVQSGLAAMRQLHLIGYGKAGAEAQEADLAFPIAEVAAAASQDRRDFSQVAVQDPMRFLRAASTSDLEAAVPQPPRRDSGWWSIVHDRCCDHLDSLSERIVQEGIERVLDDVPVGRFGELVTIDRLEIESYRSIRSLIAEYCTAPVSAKPLSIAVFGAPGAGKSFGITQIAKSTLPGRVEALTFNLSQFTGPDALLGALHQVRDAGLSGKIPLVFWDEFDTELGAQPLGWLRYFLMPMQDGRFQDGLITHPVGSAIYVFAGGTSARLADFGKSMDPALFCAVKGPDFVSRLKGAIDILGPNPQSRDGASSPVEDPHYIIRRALILRTILLRLAPHLLASQDGQERLSVDRGVLRAFLHTRTYYHGTRSMESIVLMSTLTGKSEYARSSLPPESQLNLHVDGQDFVALVQQLELEGETLESLARFMHDRFCEQRRREGYIAGPVTDEGLKTHSSLMPYDDLPDHEKELNRGLVRDVPAKLAAAGYTMRASRSDEPAFGFPGKDLELLAELEHLRWMDQKRAADWTYAPVTDKAARQHKDLVDWELLAEDQKEKDREFIRLIPEMLAQIGYTIVKMRAP